VRHCLRQAKRTLESASAQLCNLSVPNEAHKSTADSSARRNPETSTTVWEMQVGWTFHSFHYLLNIHTHTKPITISYNSIKLNNKQMVFAKIEGFSSKLRQWQRSGLESKNCNFIYRIFINYEDSRKIYHEPLSCLPIIILQAYTSMQSLRTSSAYLL